MLPSSLNGDSSRCNPWSSGGNRSGIRGGDPTNCYNHAQVVRLQENPIFNIEIHYNPVLPSALNGDSSGCNPWSSGGNRSGIRGGDPTNCYNHAQVVRLQENPIFNIEIHYNPVLPSALNGDSSGCNPWSSGGDRSGVRGGDPTNCYNHAQVVRLQENPIFNIEIHYNPVLPSALNGDSSGCNPWLSGGNRSGIRGGDPTNCYNHAQVVRLQENPIFNIEIHYILHCPSLEYPNVDCPKRYHLGS